MSSFAPGRSLLLFTALLLQIGDGRAQDRPRRFLEINKDGVRPGFPGEKSGQRWRLGAWAPVHVDLSVADTDADGKPITRGIGAGEYELVLETSDSDDVRNLYTVEVPAIAPGKTRTVVTYFRPGNRAGRLLLVVRKKDGAVAHELQRELRNGEMLNPDDLFYLALGTPLPGLARALNPPLAGEEPNEERIERSVGFLGSAEQMPSRWFGYQGVDVVVLSTGNLPFVEQLAEMSRPGQATAPVQALAEWVRRGGRLVISVGRNQQAVRRLLERLGLDGLFALEKSEPAKELPEMMRWGGSGSDSFPGARSIEVARVKPGGAALTLVRDAAAGGPVLAATPHGAGRVLLIAFDLDDPAFTGWKGQQRFWETVQGEIGPRVKLAAVKDAQRSAELGWELQRGLESFEEVPVISFGWVAFFILIYILIVGPLDYFVLKKVFKRLEWTWVTFPVVVLIISVAAYYTAYAVKGHDQRINKIDVVDIDLRDNQVSGTTWFSLFSPRVQNYNLALRPSPDWVAGNETGEPVMQTLSPPDGSPGGMDRPGGQSLFRRPYAYGDAASSLKGVPVPVWAARSFQASWRARCEPGQLFSVGGDFGLSRDGQRLIGRITNHLPVELTEVTLIYRGWTYELDDLPARGGTKLIDDKEVMARRRERNISQWLDKPFTGGTAPVGRRGEKTDAPRSAELMKPLLFHGDDSNPRGNAGNSLLRMLDQSWRLRGLLSTDQRDADLGNRRFPNEAILLARVVIPSGPADEVVTGGGSPTSLWLGTLPGEGKREELKGYLSQETYVRIYLPLGREPE